MAIQLMRASEKVSSLRVELAKVDLQSDLLQEIMAQKNQEAQHIENEIEILQAKLQGVREIGEMARVEFEKRWIKLTELQKELEQENTPSANQQVQESA